MTALRKLLTALIAGVVLLLVVVFTERHFLNAAEARGRKSGAAIQQAADQMVADAARSHADSMAQARLDSVERAAALKFSHADTVYRTARARLATDTLFQRDTAAQQVLAKADTTINACHDDVLSCAAARANAEQDAARAHLMVAQRDKTIFDMAHEEIPAPRSCVLPVTAGTTAGALVGAAAVIVFRH